jgi:hypothetical protein
MTVLFLDMFGNSTEIAVQMIQRYSQVFCLIYTFTVCCSTQSTESTADISLLGKSLTCSKKASILKIFIRETE